MDEGKKERKGKEAGKVEDGVSEWEKEEQERKANQRKAIQLMEEERKRRMSDYAANPLLADNH